MAYPPNPYKPLAERLRPTDIHDMVGQVALLGVKDGESGLLQEINAGTVRSMILWGPPGVGKTSLARLIAKAIHAECLEFSGAKAQIKELREAVDAWFVEHSGHLRNHVEDDLFRSTSSKSTAKDCFDNTVTAPKLVVFIDEIHRYNKAQQDYFLPWVEQGLFILIGATTENPGFEVNNALLSRCVVHSLSPLDDGALFQLLDRGINALSHERATQGQALPTLTDKAKALLIALSDGDGRRLLNDLEHVLILSGKPTATLNEADVKARLGQRLRRFDNGGELFYDQISALHKAVRGSSVDGALYWFSRMIDGGCDPLYIARRLIRMAVEDIGLADPQALPQVMAATSAYERLGNPEGVLCLAQAVVYLAALPKSNAVYSAYKAAKAFVAEDSTRAVPLHLRNAPNKVLKEIGAGAAYRYAHDEPHAYAAGEHYLPEGVRPQNWYQPTDRGLEKKIAERLAFLKSLDNNVKKSD